MRPAIIIAFTAAALFYSLSCTQPSSSSGTEVSASDARAALPDSLTCADLDGMTFDVTYYLDNAPHSKDVWHFAGDSIRSEMFEKEGFGYLKGICRPRTAMSVEGRARTHNDAVFVTTSFTVVNNSIDGMVSKGGNKDAGTLTLTLAGKMR